MDWQRLQLHQAWRVHSWYWLLGWRKMQECMERPHGPICWRAHPTQPSNLYKCWRCFGLLVSQSKSRLLVCPNYMYSIMPERNDRHGLVMRQSFKQPTSWHALRSNVRSGLLVWCDGLLLQILRWRLVWSGSSLLEKMPGRPQAMWWCSLPSWKWKLRGQYFQQSQKYYQNSYPCLGSRPHNCLRHC